MPVFRYEAVESTGIPVHGTTEVENESALVDSLAARGLRLVSSAELSLDALIIPKTHDLPRLYQLRVGESLREAFLTGLPAHQAVRAIAAEPFSHPILAIFPWALAFAAGIALVAAALWFPGFVASGVPLALAAVAFVLCPACWLVAFWLLQIRPHSILDKLAARLEAGAADFSDMLHVMPHELQSVMKSKVNDGQKVKSVAELVSRTHGATNHQMAINLTSSFAMMGLMLFGLYTILLFVVPDFRKVLMGFGVEVPALTRGMFNLSRMLEHGGVWGWFCTLAFLITCLIGIYYLLVSGKIGELLESVPIVGTGFRWAMQAQVARVLAVMVRNECSFVESLRAATAGSGFRSVKAEGEYQAQMLESGKKTMLPSRRLSGLPLSMLFTSDAESNRRAAIAATFENLSEMLYRATSSQGQVFAVVIHFLVVVFCAFCVGLGIVALFFPLFKLLSDLA